MFFSYVNFWFMTNKNRLYFGWYHSAALKNTCFNLSCINNRFSCFVTPIIPFSLCIKVEHCTMPGFAVGVSIRMASECKSQTEASDPPSSVDHEPPESDVVPFITCLLLGSDVTVRNWMSGFVKAGQKVHKHSHNACR